MRYRNSLKKIALSLIASGFLIGCGDSNSNDNRSTDRTDPSPIQTLFGSIIKGAIDGADITLYDKNGDKVTTTLSKEGRFEMKLSDLNSSFYTLESVGGVYLDEATKQMVTVPASDGLQTILSKAELQEMISQNKFALLTPETTIFTALVKENLRDNNLSIAMSKAETLIYDLMIRDSSPMPDMNGDKFLKTGDLTKAIPSNQSEAFAKNRAISFSNLIQALGLEPVEAFDIIDMLKEDYQDNQADITDIEGKDVNITQEFALARTRLFENTTSNLREGNLSESQQQELQAMGFDIESLMGDKTDKETQLEEKIKKYLASTTLPTLHILPTMSDEDGNSQDAKATYTLTANKNVTVKIETPDGSWNTPMWRYNNSPLPLVIRTNRGNKMTLNFNNKLDADSTIHWHGFKIPADMDGGPDVPVKANESKVYGFTMNQPASPLWFHPHPDMQTGKQVYMGLAGVYLVEDEISKKLEADKMLPSGDKDVVLLVQDRRFDVQKNGVRELLYKNKMMDSDGMKGATILVNGSVMPKLNVETTQYRFRLYNVSNAKTYDFAFSDGRKFKIVGTDGGLLNEPVEVDHIMLGAAERVELIADFSQDAVDSKVLMVSRPYKADMMNMMDGNANETEEMNMEDNGMSLAIMRFDITKETTDEITIYSTLPTNTEIATRLDPTTAINAGNSRKFVMSMYNGGNSSSNMGNMNKMNTNSNENMENNSGMGEMNGMNSNSNSEMVGNSDMRETNDMNSSSNSEMSNNSNMEETNNMNSGSTMGEMNSMSSNSNNEMGNSSGMSGMNMTFAINGKIFDPNRVDEFVGAGTTEIWEIKNMSPMAHPFHAHAIQWQILDRNGVPATGTDLGWKDTFLVQSGETVRIIGKFEAINVGDYMYHCHILEHEDAGMMGYFRVGDTGNVKNQ